MEKIKELIGSNRGIAIAVAVGVVILFGVLLYAGTDVTSIVE